jgi:hypothetical protein
MAAQTPVWFMRQMMTARLRATTTYHQLYQDAGPGPLPHRENGVVFGDRQRRVINDRPAPRIIAAALMEWN